MKVLVVGAGAVGSLFAAYLARAGHSVELVARPDHVEAIGTRGLRVLGRTETVCTVRARSSLAVGEAADAVLLTVKTFDLADAAERLARALVDPTPTLLPQNGLGVERLALPGLARGGWTSAQDWTVRAVHSVPATLVAPGVVREAGSGEVLLPDPAAVGASGARVRLFRDLLRGAGFVVRTVPEFEREVWRKVLVNAAVNPVTALRGVPNGRLLEEPAHGEALVLLREALLAARAAGVEFSEEETTREFERVVRATAENRSSMLQDLDRGRPTEVESISGEILRVAAEHLLELPATRAVAEELRRRARVRPSRPQSL